MGLGPSSIVRQFHHIFAYALLFEMQKEAEVQLPNPFPVRVASSLVSIPRLRVALSYS